MKNSPTRLRFHNNPRETGIALVTVLIMLVLVATLVSVTSILAIGNRRTSTDTVASNQAFYAAEAGIEAALDKIYWQAKAKWTTKDYSPANPEFDTCAFKKWLNGVAAGIADADIAKNNNKSCPPIGESAVNTAVEKGSMVDVRLWNDKVSKDIVSGNFTVTGQPKATYAVTGSRSDDPNTGEMNLSLISVGTLVDASGKVLAIKQIERTIKIATESFGGDRFGLLTNATNCSFCHLRVDTVRRAYSVDSTKTFERVRVGVLGTDTLAFYSSGHNIDTIIAGTLYSRGAAPTGSGSTAQVYGINFSAANATTIKGNLTNTDLLKLGDTNAPVINSGVAPGASTAGAKAYYSYPDETSVKNAPFNNSYPDGELPKVFPPIITDGDKNGLISDSEWNSYLNNAPVGTLEAKAGAALYGVRRPSSSTAIGKALPISYDPARANNFLTTLPTTPVDISAAFTSGTATSVTRQTALNTIQANASSSPYKGWILKQALSSPNNRDFLPTQFTPTLSSGAALNNFYVNYDPTTSNLSLTVCRFTDSGGNAVLPQNCGFLDGSGVASNQMLLTTQITASDLFPQTSNTATAELLANGKLDGNLIINAGSINGSSYVEVNGTVHVNGDLVVRGLIKGQGRIVVRGNIYIVGDFVYACKKKASNPEVFQACLIDNGTDESFQNPDFLPRVALLAGGSIMVGDHDAPDFRTNFFQTDLINDQTYQARTPAGFDRLDFSKASTARIPWNYYNIPGATGRQNNFGGNWPTLQLSNAKPSTGDTTGFIPRLIGKANGTASGKPAASAAGRYFAHAPFGFMIKKEASYYEGGNDGDFVSDAVNHSIVPIYPSNGPILIGSNANSGLFSASGTNELPAVNPLSCTTTTNSGSIQSIWTDKYINSIPTTVTYDRNRSFVTNTTSQVQFNYGFWCPPSTLTRPQVRNTWNTSTSKTTSPSFDASISNGSGANSTPASDPGTWQPQSIAGTPATKNANGGNADLDGGLGMSTGWLGGLVGWNGASFTQFGDFSQTRLLKLFWMSTIENSSRRTAQTAANAGINGGPLRTDGIFYSANGIFALTRYCKDGNCTSANYSKPANYPYTLSTPSPAPRGGPVSGTQGRWIHNGSVVSAELGFLMTGDMARGNKPFAFNGFKPLKDFAPVSATEIAANADGAALSILYDDRLSGVLKVEGGKGVAIRRTGVFTQGSK